MCFFFFLDYESKKKKTGFEYGGGSLLPMADAYQARMQAYMRELAGKPARQQRGAEEQRAEYWPRVLNDGHMGAFVGVCCSADYERAKCAARQPAVPRVPLVCARRMLRSKFAAGPAQLQRWFRRRDTKDSRANSCGKTEFRQMLCEYMIFVSDADFEALWGGMVAGDDRMSYEEFKKGLGVDNAVDAFDWGVSKLSNTHARQLGYTEVDLETEKSRLTYPIFKNADHFNDQDENAQTSDARPQEAQDAVVSTPTSRGRARPSASRWESNQPRAPPAPAPELPETASSFAWADTAHAPDSASSEPSPRRVVLAVPARCAVPARPARPASARRVVLAPPAPSAVPARPASAPRGQRGGRRGLLLATAATQRPPPQRPHSANARLAVVRRGGRCVYKPAAPSMRREVFARDALLAAAACDSATTPENLQALAHYYLATPPTHTLTANNDHHHHHHHHHHWREEVIEACEDATDDAADSGSVEWLLAPSPPPSARQRGTKREDRRPPTRSDRVPRPQSATATTAAQLNRKSPVISCSRAVKAKYRERLMLARRRQARAKVQISISPRPQLKPAPVDKQNRWWTTIGQELWQPQWNK